MKYFRQLGLLSIMLTLILPAGYANTLYELDFSQAQGDVKTWFKQNGWTFQGKILKMNPRFEQGGLVLEAMDSDSGAFVYEFEPSGFLSNAHHIAIEWGVEQHPAGADWSGPAHQKRNTREAIDVMITFGTEKVDSGKMIIPNLPYFIGLFPADGAETGKAYCGNYWQKGGRYFCISGDGTKEHISTRFALSDYFNETFGKTAPPVTGIAIEVDAKKTTKVNGRHSKAYIRKITIMEHSL
jgi:hypothetical protein